MNTSIFIPKKINVGFQNRDDTYTKKLAYIIYYDNKGVLRKEKSWNGWRDDEIPNVIYDNTPISGFVLNKKVGDYCCDWNHRQAYVRVYDPRDFEFEITIENLLYILENASSIKGKGLEGEFTYGWEGKDLILIPTASPDYIEISKYNEILHQNNHVKVKDLIIGATYKTKANEEWIYMGRFDYWKVESERVEQPTSDCYGYSRYSYKYIYKDVNKGKHHFFVRETKGWDDKPHLNTLILKSLGDKFIETVSPECVENYANLFDKLERQTEYSPLDENRNEYVLYTFEEFYKKLKDNHNYCYCYDADKKEIYVHEAYNNPEQYYFEDRHSNYPKEQIQGTLKEIFTILKPMYKNQYLKNGKLYREEK